MDEVGAPPDRAEGTLCRGHTVPVPLGTLTLHCSSRVKQGSSWQPVEGNKAVTVPLERGRLYFSKCPWLLQLLFYGAITVKVLLWETRMAIIKQVYICL